MSFNPPRVTKLDLLLLCLRMGMQIFGLYCIFTRTGVMWLPVGFTVLVLSAWVRSIPKYDGTIDVEHVDGVKRFSLNLHSDPESLDTRKTVTFKINPS
jgi:hypothetical protein